MTASPQTLALALDAYRSGNPAEAARIYRQVVAEEPENADIWCLLGVARRAMGDIEGAGHAYREALRLRPGFVEARINLGNVLVHQGKPAEAEVCYREVLRLRPNHAEAQEQSRRGPAESGSARRSGGLLRASHSPQARLSRSL